MATIPPTEADIRAFLSSEPGSTESDLHVQRIGTVAAELLLRPRSVTGAPLRPDQFVRLADGLGEGVALDRWVLRRAEQIADQLEKSGFQIRLSVNVTPSTVRSGQLPYDSTKHRFRIEITEDTHHDRSRIDEIAAFARSVRTAGYTVSLDDFSETTKPVVLWQVLRDVSDEIKLDLGPGTRLRTLISGAELPATDRAFIDSVLESALDAHAIGSTLVVERGSRHLGQSLSRLLDQTRDDHVQFYRQDFENHIPTSVKNFCATE